jgi:hypothetical protein
VRNFVICYDGQSWWPAITLPASHWEAENMFPRDSLYPVRYLHLQEKYFGMISRENLRLVTDIRSGTCSIFESAMFLSSYEKTNQVALYSGTQEIVLSRGQILALQAVAQRKLRGCLWPRWKAELSLYLKLETGYGGPIYAPVSNIDISVFADLPARPAGKPKMPLKDEIKSKMASTSCSEFIEISIESPRVDITNPCHATRHANCIDVTTRPSSGNLSANVLDLDSGVRAESAQPVEISFPMTSNDDQANGVKLPIPSLNPYEARPEPPSSLPPRPLRASRIASSNFMRDAIKKKRRGRSKEAN